MSKIRIDGHDYRVVENLGFVHSVGMFAKIVQTPDGERKAVGKRGLWRFWTPDDRVRPLRGGLTRKARRHD